MIKNMLPLGFKANGVSSGIKRRGKLDLALIYSNVKCKAIGLFTSNKIQAAPIKICKDHLRKSKDFYAVLINSGNANCFTGKNGIKIARSTAQSLSKSLGIKEEQVLVASTGIIGRRLPLVKIKKTIPQLVMGLSREGIEKAKKAIMTTDTFTKEVSIKFNISKRTVTICGIAKGAGMIAPNLATMLCFILTDANISQAALNKALKICVDNSFNCITVDGCMSTNDSIILLANGASKNNLIKMNKYFNSFIKALNIVCLELAKMIVTDAEGASKFIEIKVSQACNFAEAKKVALAIANSNLFKTAIYGENPNFGRIVTAVGASGIGINEKGLKIKVSPLYKKEIKVEVGLSRGVGECKVYTCDLTPEYIKINAEYS